MKNGSKDEQNIVLTHKL